MEATIGFGSSNFLNTTQVTELPLVSSSSSVGSFLNPDVGLNRYERILILTWNSTIALISIVGNITVLLSSIKYNAIHLDRISIILIRNLAAADLGFGLCLVTTSVNGGIERNGFGYSLCVAFSFLSALFMSVSSNLLAGLNINKVIVLLFPLRSNARRFRRGNIISGVVWALMTLLLAAVFVLTRNYTFQFNKYSFRCSRVADPDIFLRSFLILLQIFSIFLPLVCVFVTTLWMGCFVRRVSGIQRQTIFTLLLVSITFFLSLAPANLFFILKIQQDEGQASEWFHILQIIFPMSICINCAANPFIYCVTVRSFGAFMKMKVVSVRNNLRGCLLRACRRNRIRIVDLAARASRNATTAA